MANIAPIIPVAIDASRMRGVAASATTIKAMRPGARTMAPG